MDETREMDGYPKVCSSEVGLDSRICHAFRSHKASFKVREGAHRGVIACGFGCFLVEYDGESASVSCLMTAGMYVDQLDKVGLPTAYFEDGLLTVDAHIDNFLFNEL